MAGTAHIFQEENLDMSNLRLKLNLISSKKVPLLSLLLVAIVGMVVGVLAANISVTPNSFTGAMGTYNTNTGTMTVNDQGLSIVTNAGGISPNTTATFGANGSNSNLYNGATFTGGHWMETIVFTNTATDSASHDVTIKVVHGPGVPNGGTVLASVTLILTGHGSSSTGTVTDYIDLGTSTITAPMTVYVTST
jgi:hypothetical protein